MAFSWTRTTAGIVNAEGNLIVFGVTLTNNEFFHRPNVDVAATVGRNEYVGEVQKWRSRDDGTIFARDGTDPDAADPGLMETGVFPFNMGEVLDLGGGIHAVEFKVGIWLRPTQRIAVRADDSTGPAPKILRLRNAGAGQSWLTLDTGGDAPQWDDIPLDTSAVGRIPDIGGACQLNTDSQAQWVKGDGAAADPLTAWDDLAAADNNLTGSGNPTLSNAGGGRIAIEFGLDASSSNDHFAKSSPPVITIRGTFAAALIPDASTPSTSHIIGRYHNGGRSWRLYYAPNDHEVVYQTRSGGATISLSLPTEVDIGEIDPVYDSSILVLLRREVLEGVGVWTAWVNGRTFQDSSTIAASVDNGINDLTVGARVIDSSPLTWGEAFKGEINQTAVYDEWIDDIKASLVLHQMANRANIDLGTPIKAGWRTQPYDPAANPSLPANRRLDRKPIALINLNTGFYASNAFGQSDDIWRLGNTEAIKAALRPLIRKALGESDQFELMFNRPGGKYQQDIVPSYVFGDAPADASPSGGEPMIQPEQWEAIKDLFTEFNLSDHNDPDDRTANGRKMRRAWFYTGGGLPVNDDGTLNEQGLMFNRVVAPATPLVYKTQLLDHWIDEGGVGDDRFRCFFLDAMVDIYGKFVELVHDEDIQENFTLVGEAIPQSDPENELFANQVSSRLAAPWFSLAGIANGPWWNPDPDINGQSAKRKGYNRNWTTEWVTKPIYFGIQANGVLNLHITESNPGEGSDLSIGDIYRWVIKGATPVAWNPEVYRKVAAAFDYGTGRVLPSRVARNPRCVRGIRV